MQFFFLLKSFLLYKLGDPSNRNHPTKQVLGGEGLPCLGLAGHTHVLDSDC